MKNNIVEHNKFYDDGSLLHENRNFENYLFEKIDLRNSKEPMNFYRCDFRGSKMTDMCFWKNDFNRSDFVDSFIEKSIFSNCSFGTDFFNTYFTDVEFIENNQAISSIINCVFESCTFIEEKFSDTTIRDCSFINCTFNNCIFVMNTIDNIEFEKCRFTKIDFSNTTAKDFTFTQCKYDDFIINPDYLGTYLFKETPLNNIIYSYKGDEFNIGENYLDNIEVLINYYGKMKRYYEFFNLVIIYNYLSHKKKSITKLFNIILNNTIHDPHYLRKQKNIEKLFFTLEFYVDSSIINMVDYFSILKDAEAISLDNFGFQEKLKYLMRLNSLKVIVENNILNWDAIKSIPINIPILVEIRIEEEMENAFLLTLDKYFKVVANEYLDQSNGTGYYIITNKYRGSIVFEIVTYSLAMIPLAISLRIISASLFNIYFDYSICKKSVKLLDNNMTKNEVMEIEKLRRNTIERPTKDLEKTARELGDLIKTIKIFINAFKN